MFRRSFSRRQSIAAFAEAAAAHSCRNIRHFPRQHQRPFHASIKALAVKPFILADIGEGIRECEVIQWFVEPEARVEQFDKLCEVQSDKASVEITSRFDGVIKKLYYEAGEMALVGKPLCDIDILGEVIEEPVAAAITPPVNEDNPSIPIPEPPHTSESAGPIVIQEEDISASQKGKNSTLATPAVRHLTKGLNVDIAQVTGTGKEGRVTKEDIHRFVEERNSSPDVSSSTTPELAAIVQPQTGARVQDVPQKEEAISLTPVQAQMFKAMTRSLTIPQFLYADEVTMDSVVRLRSRINTSLCSTSPKVAKISFLPFIIKAVSLALEDYPLLNSRVDSAVDSKPLLVMRAQHNIGVAMDTPQGLLVPNIKDVGSKSILEVATELQRLQAAGASGKLSAADLTGGTISVSNIGNLGGTYVAPVIVTSEVAILGIGRAKTVPAFDTTGAVVPRTVVNMSWSADHRVVDGSTMARMANRVKLFTEEPELMIARMR
ncbi:hypothetical protein FGG08_001680 [Glutinoglossum americanum]|uniref:Dihydrolipoamide acetyltransferase component of pyruvate dehydrogenase complex n=1 Tax=Glutinoglossum americanum TaxID=1670608 RepID=A0A9P8IGE6_9PEZI|nr:hypothetical protein FGG08_001680 [Glutinoglossum americanum]